MSLGTKTRLARLLGRRASAATNGGDGLAPVPRRDRRPAASGGVELLLDELAETPGVDTVLLAAVDEEEERASGVSARGADESWWRSIVLDLREEGGGISTAARERSAHAVYDLGVAAAAHRLLLETIPAKSAAFVPLVADGRVSGVAVALATTSHRFFSQGELDRMQELAAGAAATLARTRSNEALAAALERERLVAEIARKVRSELDLDSVLQVAVEETARALAVARCFIRLGAPGETLPIAAEWDAPGVQPIGAAAERLPASNLALRERRTVAVSDVLTDRELDDPLLGGRETLVALGARAVLATPLVVFDRTIGVFGLHRAESGAWAPADVALAEAVARELALAIHTARLLQEDERRLAQQAALLNAAQVVTTDLRFESVMRRLVDQVVALMGADAADCYIFDAEHKMLRCRAAYGLTADVLGREIPSDEGTIGEAVATGRTILRHDFTATEDPPPSRFYAGFHDVIVAPIVWLGEVRGVLGLGSRDPERRFDATDVEIADAFARLASLALHNAESFEERERQAQIQQGFYRIAEVLGSPLSLAETFDALAQAACEALGGEAAVVLEPSGDQLVLAGAFELPAALDGHLQGGMPAAAGPFLAAAREERIVASSALSEDERIEERWRTLLRETGYRALLAAPVVGSRGQHHSALVLFTEERTFSDDDLALARHLSHAARGALERSELFETERRARGLSQRLASIGARLVTNLDPAVVLEEIVREAPVLLEGNAAVIRLLEGDELVVRATHGPVTGLVGTRASSGAGLPGDVAQSRAPATIDDVRAAPNLGRSDPLLEKGMAACVGAPMIAHGGGLHGVISVYSATARAWRQDEVQALVALAAVASAALSNAELYQRVAEEKERNDAILRNIADGIVAVDRDERIVLWNSMAEEITGVPAEEALGRRVAEALQQELAGDGTQPPGERPVTILRAGKEVYLSLTEAVMRDRSGAVIGRIFAFRDVSSERVVEQMKSDFVSTVSHELRTPLTSIYGFAETLLRSDVDFGEPERTTFLGYIASESERLIRIVDDLLNVARLEAGTLGMSMADTDVAEVIAETVTRVEAVDHSHRFVVDTPPGGLCARADRDKLAQIVLHLVDNAVKFSPDGGTVTVSARRKTDTVEVRVVDEGVGIPRSDQHRIFTKFYRAETAPLTGVHGTGLGLFLVRGLLAAMNGRIAVESKEGEGSSFVFEIPAAKMAAGVETAETGLS